MADSVVAFPLEFSLHLFFPFQPAVAVEAKQSNSRRPSMRNVFPTSPLCFAWKFFIILATRSFHQTALAAFGVSLLA